MGGWLPEHLKMQAHDCEAGRFLFHRNNAPQVSQPHPAGWKKYFHSAKHTDETDETPSLPPSRRAEK
jgi:hypothetical protein